MSKIVSILLALLVIPLSTFAQSSYLEMFQNGPGFNIGFLIGEQTLLRAGGTLGFSIGGKMDLGILLENGPEDSLDNETRFTDIGISYGYLVLKQGTGMPFSVGVSGAYVLSNILSDNLDIQLIEKSGTGWTAGTQLFRDFRLSPVVGWRLGGEFEYRAYRYETIDLDNPEDPPIKIDRLQQFLYGGFTDIILWIPSGPVIAAGLAVLFDEDSEVNFRPSLSFAQPLR